MQLSFRLVQAGVADTSPDLMTLAAPDENASR